MSAEFDNISFNLPKTQSNSIKVIGVGGGGSNAVDHMFNQHIKGVDFVICNTDAQALESSSIPNKIQLGANLTAGLGAGSNPEIGAQAAKESMQEIQQMLNTQTKMVFITAGMGGGTGTGAAPIIAKIAKDMEILTVGIVTMPFAFEGKVRTRHAQEGINQLRQNVDSLIIINNNKLREVYGNLSMSEGFSKADEVLSTASKGIAEVITHHYKQNIDLHDAKTVLSNSGTAIMGSAKEEGKERAHKAIVKALDSPLLNDNKITGAKDVLLLIVSGTREVTLDEIGEINDYIQDQAGNDANIIMGAGLDEKLGEAISITIVATGFAADQQSSITNTEVKKIVHTLEDDQKATYNFTDKKIVRTKPIEPTTPIATEPKIVHSLIDDTEDNSLKSGFIKTTEAVANIPVVFNDLTDKPLVNDDFVITNAPNAATSASEIVLEQPQEVQTNLVFDLPIKPKKTIVQTTENVVENVNNAEVFEAQQLVSSKKEEEKTTRYVLEDFTAEPTIGKSSHITAKKKPVEEEEVVFELKTVAPSVEKTITEVETFSEEISPMDLTISQLQERTAERRSKMKNYNHQFKSQSAKNIEEYSKIPAFKRRGVNLDLDSPISNSKTAINKDENNLDLRSNNSFLHDNVD